MRMQRLLDRMKDMRDPFPPAIRQFLVRALVLFIAWQALYLFLWRTPRTLDEPPTRSVGRQTTWVLNFLHGTDLFREHEI